MTHLDLDAIRNARPLDRRQLWRWICAYTGVRIAHKAVCRGHRAPFDSFAESCLDRPPVMLVLGSRGSGKSFLSALGLHHDCRFHPNHKARILGGSKDQSRQIYEALTEHVRDGKGHLGGDGGADVISSLLVERARYRNGSEVSILAASPTSVRGPHVPTLRLDEVDEIDADIRESAMGMCMAKGGLAASVVMTSTWHRPSGPMKGLIEQAKDGAFPLHTYCTFEVLERCPEDRSGPNLEKCPECPIVKWCHEDRANDPSLPPKAKLSDGHYAIESLIQKTRTTSLRVFEADYLCKGPKADGIWFPDFDEARHVGIAAEFDPALAVHLAVDTGVFTGAVLFQVRPGPAGAERVHVLADYLSEGISAESNARAIVRLAELRCNGRIDTAVTDPAGKARNAVGPAVIEEYRRSGLKHLEAWPLRPVADGLALLESFISPASGPPTLAIHPRCRHLIDALKSYRRAGKPGQWADNPLDPQHPAEDMVDTLRGGLFARFPDGRKAPFAGVRRKASSLHY